MKTEFNVNEKVIWNSGFGYEIGYFIGEGNIMGTYLIDTCSGVVIGENSYPKRQIEAYSNERILELTKEYGYQKSFSEIF